MPSLSLGEKNQSEQCKRDVDFTLNWEIFPSNKLSINITNLTHETLSIRYASIMDVSGELLAFRNINREIRNFSLSYETTAFENIGNIYIICKVLLENPDSSNSSDLIDRTFGNPDTSNVLADLASFKIVENLNERDLFIFLLILILFIFLILLIFKMTSNSESRILLKKQRKQNEIELKKRKETELKIIKDERIQKEKAEEAELKRIEDERIQKEKAEIELKKQKEKEEFELKQELDLVKAVYAEKEIEEQKKIEEKLKLQQEQLEQERQKKIEELRKLNFEDVKEKKEKLEKEIGLDEVKSSRNIKINEKEHKSPTLQALKKLKFNEELSLDGYEKIDTKYKQDILKYIHSVIETFLELQKSAVHTIGQKIQKDDSERNFLIYILFEYGCIDGMCIILNISPEVGQKIAIEIYNLQNQVLDKKFDAQKRKDAIELLLTNQDTLEIAREIHQKGIKSIYQFYIEQDDTASLDIINFLNNEKIQFQFNETNWSKDSQSIDDILIRIAEFYNSYHIGLLGNPEKLKEYGKDQFENIVNSSKFFWLSAQHYDEGDGNSMAIIKTKTALLLFSLCESKKIDDVDEDLRELLRRGKAIDLSDKLLNSLKLILGKSYNENFFKEQEIELITQSKELVKNNKKW